MHEHDPEDLELDQRLADEREARRARRESRLESLIRWQMQGPNGRAFVRELIETAGIDDRLFEFDPARLQRSLGFRAFGLQLRERVQRLCPAEYRLMEEEAQKERDRDGRTTDSKRSTEG